MEALAAGVNPELVIAAGATAFRKVVPEAQLPGVLAAYSSAIGHVFYLGIGISAAAVVFGSFLGWKDIRTSSQGAVDDGGSGDDAKANNGVSDGNQKSMSARTLVAADEETKDSD